MSGAIGRDSIGTYWMSSLESTDGTNSLLMKRPVGTFMCLLLVGILTETDCAMGEGVK